jgi:hypothetical protein
VLWRDMNGQNGSGLAADGNNDQQINQTDYTIWRENFGKSSQLIVGTGAASGTSIGSTGGAPIPEPASACMLVCSIFVLTATSGRCHRISRGGHA